MTYSDFRSTPDDWFKELTLGRYLWGFPKFADAAFNSTLADIRKKKIEERIERKRCQTYELCAAHKGTDRGNNWYVHAMIGVKY